MTDKRFIPPSTGPMQDPPATVIWADGPAMTRLETMIAGLDAHIERRAREIAQPLIDAAQAEAREAVGAARADARRWKDCNDELRRRIASLERRLETTRARLADAQAESRQNAEIAAAALDRQGATDADH